MLVDTDDRISKAAYVPRNGLLHHREDKVKRSHTKKERWLMAKAAMGKSRFDLLQHVPARHEQAEPVAPRAATTDRKSRPLGKRSDPAYRQISIFLPKLVHDRIRKRCFLAGEDLSDFMLRAVKLLEQAEPARNK